MNSKKILSYLLFFVIASTNFLSAKAITLKSEQSILNRLNFSSYTIEEDPSYFLSPVIEASQSFLVSFDLGINIKATAGYYKLIENLNSQGYYWRNREGFFYGGGLGFTFPYFTWEKLTLAAEIEAEINNYFLRFSPNGNYFAARSYTIQPALILYKKGPAGQYEVNLGIPFTFFLEANFPLQLGAGLSLSVRYLLEDLL